MIVKYNKVELGYFGERWVMFELAKRRIPAMSCPPTFDYDLITWNDVRIEVKTSTIGIAKKKYKNRTYNWEKWQFANHKTTYDGMVYKSDLRLVKNIMGKRSRNCDFFAFVCLDKNHNVIKIYIVPKKEIGDRRQITIYVSGRSKLEKYKERWDLIK